MEAQHIIEELGEPIISFISNHEVIDVDHKKVSVCVCAPGWQQDAELCHCGVSSALGFSCDQPA